MYFGYGFPKSFRIFAGEDTNEEVVYASFNGSDYLVVVTTTALQLWSGGQQRIKLGELVRDAESLENDGRNTHAWWCPSKRVIAVATDHGSVLFFGLHPSKEVLWRFPDGQEARKVSIYLQNIVVLSESKDANPAERVVDFCGDSRTVLVMLQNGTMLAFSWSAKLRCTASPFSPTSQDPSNSRSNRSRLRRGSSAAAPSASTSDSSEIAAPSPVPDIAWYADTYARSDSLPLPTPVEPQEVPIGIRSINYAPAVRLLVATLLDGRVALLSLPPGSLADVDQARLVRWVYKPRSPGVAAVSAAVQPGGHYIAVGLAHGRVAIFTTARILSPKRGNRSNTAPPGSLSGNGPDFDSPRAGLGGGPASWPNNIGAGQPEPDRVLSLTEWGYSSSLLGAAHVVQWSPDGKVVAAGYSLRGLAVWTPSGCRVVCTLRQAAQGMVAPGSSNMEGRLPSADEVCTRDSMEGSVEIGEYAERSLGTPSGLNPQHSTPAPDAGILERGVAALAWSQHGYTLAVIEVPKFGWDAAAGGVPGSVGQRRRRQQQLLELSFARSVHGAHRVAEAPQGPSVAGEGNGAAAALPMAAGSAADGAADSRGGGSGHSSSSPSEIFALQAADRLLLVLETAPSSAAAMHAGLLDATEAEAVMHFQPDLTLQHVKLPQQYLDSAFPVLHVSVAPGNRDIAVAGTRGLAVLNCCSHKWRLFGDAMQERRVKAHALSWLPRGVIAIAGTLDDAVSSSAISASKSGLLPSTGSSGSIAGAAPAVLLFPRDHLDFSSLLTRLPLTQLPASMHAVGSYLALAFNPLEITLFRVDYTNAANDGSLQAASLTPVRELSILGLGGPLQELTVLPPPLPSLEDGPDQNQKNPSLAASVGGAGGNITSAAAADTNGVAPSSAVSGAAAGSREEGDIVPSHCVLLRGGGILSVLDLNQGTECVLADEIESYWLPLSSGTKPALPAPTPPSASFSRDDSAAAMGGGGGGAGPGGLMPSDEAISPVARGAAWLERRTSDAAAISAMVEELGAMTAAGGGAAGEAEALPVELPWWTYGARGMQLWFPSSLFDPGLGYTGSNGASLDGLRGSGGGSGSMTVSSPRAAAGARGGANATDPELEFDREVYPLGISMAEVSIVGMMQRTARSGAFVPGTPPALSLHPHPESQPVLPCLLRRLLEQGRAADALELATRHSRGPHFGRSLEWLLFTTLEADADAPKDLHNSRRVRFSSPRTPAASQLDASPLGGVARALSPNEQKRARRASAGPLLIAAARLVQQFPQFAEIVVSVARKTDAQLWPALFTAAGSPSDLCEGLLSGGALQTAACCLLIVDQVEGAGKAHGLALRLVRAALAASAYDLVTDLLRFLMPPGESELGELVSPVELNLDPAAAAAEQRMNSSGKSSSSPGKQEGGIKGPEGGLLTAQGTPQRATSGTAQHHQQQQPASPGGKGTSTWLWGLITGADKLPAGTSSTSGTTTAAATEDAASTRGRYSPTPPGPTSPPQGPSNGSEESLTKRLHRAASAVSMGDPSEDHYVIELGAAVSAWRAMGRHAWKLLDSGALKELASFGVAMSNLHGGLPALLSTTAGEVPLALAHTTPSAAAIASALFVASNEFAATDTDPDTASAAVTLQTTCAAAGCVNHAAALALMLGDVAAVEAFSNEHPHVWGVLTDLVANDVHLCAFAGMMTPPGTPLVMVT